MKLESYQSVKETLGTQTQRTSPPAVELSKKVLAVVAEDDQQLQRLIEDQEADDDHFVRKTL